MIFDKKSQLITRIFCIGFAVAFARALYDGGFCSYSIGTERCVTPDGAPMRYWLSILWYAAVFLVCSYLGVIKKLVSE